jgi:hypothetical protein
MLKTVILQARLPDHVITLHQSKHPTSGTPYFYVSLQKPWPNEEGIYYEPKLQSRGTHLESLLAWLDQHMDYADAYTVDTCRRIRKYGRL